jgi:ketosteroid isomerase-like protein
LDRLAFSLPRAHKEARQQIEELEQQWRVATLTSDSASMDRLLSDDYVGISWNGQVNTKAMQLDRTRTHAFALSRLDLSDERVKVVGNVAIVTATANVEGSIEGSPMGGIFRYTRVYERMPSGVWKITNFEATRVNPRTHEHHTHNPTP